MDRRPPSLGATTFVITLLATLALAGPAGAYVRTPPPTGLQSGYNLVNAEVVWAYEKPDTTWMACYETQGTCKVINTPSQTLIKQVPYEKNGINNSVTRAIKPVASNPQVPYDTSAGTNNPLAGASREAVKETSHGRAVRRGLWALMQKLSTSDMASAAARVVPWSFDAVIAVQVGTVAFHYVTGHNDTVPQSADEANPSGMEFMAPGQTETTWGTACGQIPADHGPIVLLSYVWWGCSPSNRIDHLVRAGTVTLVGWCEGGPALQIPSGWGVTRWGLFHGDMYCDPVGGSDNEYVYVSRPLADFMSDAPHPPVASEPTPTSTVTIAPPGWIGDPGAGAAAAAQIADPANEDAINALIRNQGGLPGSTCTDCAPGNEDGTYITVPSCSGQTYSACVQTLQNAGYTGTPTRVNVPFSQIDTTKGANEVLSMNPSPSALVETDGTLITKTNPPQSEMPVVVPPPGDLETYTEYSARLSQANLASHSSTLRAPEYAYGSGSAVRTTPAVGTRVAPQTDITVFVNPVYDEPRDQTCERSIPTLSDPNSALGWNANAGQYALLNLPGFSSSFPAYGGRTAYLRWGRTRPVDPNTGKAWPGWGYRHISAKHGWSTADQTDTAAALLKPPASTGSDGTSFVYIGARYKVGKVFCHRRVVVQYAANANDEIINGWPAKGIITSYAELD